MFTVTLRPRQNEKKKLSRERMSASQRVYEEKKISLFAQAKSCQQRSLMLWLSACSYEEMLAQLGKWPYHRKKMTLLGAVPLLSEPTYCFFFSSRVNGSMSQKVLCPKTTPQPISDPRPNLNHDMAYFNPRAYMQIHTSTVVQGGGRLDDPPPPLPPYSFLYTAVFWNDFTLTYSTR